MGHAQEVRPEFGFRDNDELGLKGCKVRLQAELKIEWKVEGILLSEPVPGELLASIRGGGNYDSMLWIFEPKLSNKFADGQDFADGNSV
jgi:hypothetical protein